MSGRRARRRWALAVAALALTAAAAGAIVARSGGAGADGAHASKFNEPRISPSCVPPRLNVSAALAGSRVTV